MTIYGTPGSTPANTSFFQGTAPGNPVQATLQPVNPGVGMFPPNSNNLSGDSLLASASRATLPLNAMGSGYGLTSNAANGTAAGGRPILEALGNGERNGTNSQAGVGDTFNSDLNGGQSLGAGGANQTEGPSSGTSFQASTQQPANTIVFQAPANTYGG